MNKLIRGVALAAMAAWVATPASAQTFNLNRSLADISYYATLGRSDVGYNDNGFGMKVGASTSIVFPEYPWLGATTFYAYTSGGRDYNFTGCGNWRLRNHSIAAGPTATLPLASGFSLEGRVFLSANIWRIGAGCSTYNSSGTDLDVGGGGSLRYQLSPTFSLRADIDKIGWRSTLFSVGATLKF
jgi:hypothetical protein